MLGLLARRILRCTLSWPHIRCAALDSHTIRPEVPQTKHEYFETEAEDEMSKISSSDKQNLESEALALDKEPKINRRSEVRSRGPHSL